MHELTKYSDSLPNAREIKLREEIDLLEKEVEKYRFIESRIQSKAEYLENLCIEADEAKKVIIE